MDSTKRRTEIIAINPLGEEHMLELAHSGELRITNLGERIVLEEDFGNNYETLATFPAEFAVILCEGLQAEIADSEAVGIVKDSIAKSSAGETDDRLYFKALQRNALLASRNKDLLQEIDDLKLALAHFQPEDPGDEAVREMFVQAEAPQPDPNPGAQLGEWTVYRHRNSYFITDDAPREAENHHSLIVQTGLHRNAACALADGLNGIPESRALDYIRRGDLD